MQPYAQLDEYKSIMKRLPLVAESLDSRGLYLFDDGLRFVLWFGRMLSPDIAMNLLGPEFAAELSKVCHVFWYLQIVAKNFRVLHVQSSFSRIIFCSERIPKWMLVFIIDGLLCRRVLLLKKLDFDCRREK